MKQVFKARYGNFITYNVLLEIEDILIIEDTSCKHEHPDEKCRVKIRKDNNHYVFEKCLNNVAKEFEDYHTGEFFNTKKECLKSLIEREILSIEGYNENLLKENEERRSHLPKTNKAKKFLTADSKSKYGYYRLDGEVEKSNIVGNITFTNSEKGLLTNDNYCEKDYDDNYVLGDRIIFLLNEDGKYELNNDARTIVYEDYDSVVEEIKEKENEGVLNDIKSKETIIKRNKRRISSLKDLLGKYDDFEFSDYLKELNKIFYVA